MLCCVLRNIFGRCETHSEAGSQHSETLLCNKVKMNHRGNTGYRLPAQARFICITALTDAALTPEKTERHFALAVE